MFVVVKEEARVAGATLVVLVMPDVWFVWPCYLVAAAAEAAANRLVVRVIRTFSVDSLLLVFVCAIAGRCETQRQQ